ncbi:hypothetical protein [Belnapia rosea]|uniref:hypothetical protein n=1 Tax=Belnapia rosea TaxID=938405 RepID=UPI00115FADE5|nr:hypothetical protein [Belnapia rosea]
MTPHSAASRRQIATLRFNHDELGRLAQVGTMLYEFFTDHDGKDRQMSWVKIAILMIISVPLWIAMVAGGFWFGIGVL